MIDQMFEEVLQYAGRMEEERRGDNDMEDRDSGIGTFTGDKDKMDTESEKEKSEEEEEQLKKENKEEEGEKQGAWHQWGRASDLPSQWDPVSPQQVSRGRGHSSGKGPAHLSQNRNRMPTKKHICVFVWFILFYWRSMECTITFIVFFNTFLYFIDFSMFFPPTHSD